MEADDPCGPAIDFDNTGCLRISGASLFLFPAFPSVPSFLPFRRPSRYPFTPFFLLSVPVPLPSAPLAFRFRLLSVCCRFPLLRSVPPILFRHSVRMHFGILQKTPKAFGRKGRSAAVYSAASGRITTFTRLLSSRIFWASFCTSAFETVRMACSPLAT